MPNRDYVGLRLFEPKSARVHAMRITSEFDAGYVAQILAQDGFSFSWIERGAEHPARRAFELDGSTGAPLNTAAPYLWVDSSGTGKLRINVGDWVIFKDDVFQATLSDEQFDQQYRRVN